MRGMEKHGAQGSSSRYSTRSNRANARTTRKEMPSSSSSTTRSHISQSQLPPPPLPPPPESTPGTYEYLPSFLPPTTTGMPSDHRSMQPSLVHQPYPPEMPSVRLEVDDESSQPAILPSPGATTPTTGTSIPSPPPNNSNDTSTTSITLPDYPQSAYNYGTWTTEEDKTLLAARGQGHHWALIQRTHFPSKTANACRKRYERLMERRGIYDLDREKLEKVAHEYMGMRKEIWSGLAARVGEKWNVVEAQCMSSGLRTIQLNARSHARRQRHESRVNQRTSIPSQQQQYPYLNTTDNGMVDMINQHGNVGSTLLAPVGFAPISPLDDEHPPVHHHQHASHTYGHGQQGHHAHGGWTNGTGQSHQHSEVQPYQHQHQHHQHGYGHGPGPASQAGNSSRSSDTPTAEMGAPTSTTMGSSTSTSNLVQGQGYREYSQGDYHHHQHHAYESPSTSTAPPGMMLPNMEYTTGYNMRR